MFRRAIEVNDPIAIKYPDDVQIQFDLAKCHHNLGELLIQKGDVKQGLPHCSGHVRLTSHWSRHCPKCPAMRAFSLLISPAGVSRYSLSISLKSKRPTAPCACHLRETGEGAPREHRVSHRTGSMLVQFGPTLATADHAEQAENMYQRALALLDTKDKNATASQLPELLRSQAQTSTI